MMFAAQTILEPVEDDPLARGRGLPAEETVRECRRLRIHRSIYCPWKAPDAADACCIGKFGNSPGRPILDPHGCVIV
jgi:hypothetical protein